MKLNPFKYLKDRSNLFMSKNPRKKWEFIRDINANSLQYVGCEIMKPDYSSSWKTMVPIYLGLNYMVSMSYALYHYRSNPLKAMQNAINAIAGVDCSDMSQR